MTENKNILNQFISNIEQFSNSFTNHSVLKFKNVNSKLIIRIYRKDFDLIEEKEISENGDYAIFLNLKKKGNYRIALMDDSSFYQKSILLR